MLTMVNPIDFRGHSSKVKVMMGIIDKCGARGDVPFCVVIFSFCSRINTPRDKGGLGPMNIPLLSDITHEISKAYGVYLQDLGHSLR